MTVGRWLYDLGRAYLRIAGFLLLTAIVGLPFAVILPRQPGLVLLLAAATAAVVRVARQPRRR